MSPAVRRPRGALRVGHRRGRDLRRRHVMVVGGANSAGQAALHLATHAKHVTMLVRGESLARAMSRYLVDPDRSPRADHSPDRHKRHARRRRRPARARRDRRTRREQTLEAGGLFVLIGGEPLTAGVEGWLRRDPHGYFMTGPDAACRGRPRLVAARARDPLFSNRASPACSSPATYVTTRSARGLGRRRRRDGDRARAQLPGPRTTDIASEPARQPRSARRPPGRESQHG